MTSSSFVGGATASVRAHAHVWESVTLLDDEMLKENADEAAVETNIRRETALINERKVKSE